MAMIKGAKRKPKPCSACGVMFTPKGNASKFCNECSEFRKLWGKWRDSVVKTIKQGGIPHVGSGGMNRGVGKCHHTYRRVHLDDIHSEQEGRCFICYTKLDKPDMILHHVDHDRTNNTRENLEGVCKRCHQIEHRCWENFSKV